MTESVGVEMSSVKQEVGSTIVVKKADLKNRGMKSRNM